ELRRCAGTQFDPALVERFITVLERQHRPIPGIGHVDKQFALQIGLEIERIADTLDGQDIHGLESLASRLKETAAKNGIAPIAEAAERLEASTRGEPKLEQILGLTQELLSLCRSTQRAFLADAETDASAGR
ncbi:MAG: diguanylate cyclase, partial [Pirellulaceae bacterium]